MSKVYSFKRVQQITISLQEAWLFFSAAENLVRITPKDMKFKIISSPAGRDLYPGQIIEYKVTPLLGIGMYWMTEITHVSPPNYFVDEQRFGPYSFWHHQHHFRQIDGGIEMTDIVHYKLPLGILGDWANTLFVQQKLNSIFGYRKKIIEEIFSTY